MSDCDPLNNLILCGNQDFIIMVDEPEDKNIRYRCWRRPKTTSDAPDLILLHGETRMFDPEDKMEFVFSYGNWSYAIEKIISKKHQMSFIFLEVNDGDKQQFTWKLQAFEMPSKVFDA